MSDSADIARVGRTPKEPTTPEGKWVRHVREQIARMTQEAFAAEVGIDRPTVSNWERGEYAPGWDSITKIMQRFPAAPLPTFGGAGALPQQGRAAKPTTASLLQAIQEWCVAAGDPALVDDDEFVDGLLQLFADYKRRKAAIKTKVR